MGGAVRALRASDSLLYDTVPDGYQLIGGRGVILDGEKEGRDVDGIYFARTADLGASNGNGTDLTFNHTLPIVVEGQEGDFPVRLAEHRFKEPIRTKRFDTHLYFEALLDLADEYEAFAAELARTGKLGASSGAPEHLVRVKSRTGKSIRFGEALMDGFGRVERWPIAEIAITPMPADPRTRGVMPLRSWQAPAITADFTPASAAPPVTVNVHIHNDTQQAMNENEAQATTTEAPAQPPAVPTPAPAADPTLEAVRSLLQPVLTRLDDLEAAPDNTTRNPRTETPASRGLPVPPQAPVVIADTEHFRYDNISTGDLALTLHVLADAARRNLSAAGSFARPMLPAAYKALAARILGDEGRQTPYLAEAATSFRRMAAVRGIDVRALRANEIHQSTLANGADEWVGVAYSGMLWDDIRGESNIIGRLNPQPWPWPGSESGVIPVLDGDVSVYKVAQASALSSNPGGIPTNTVTSSQLDSGNVTATLAKFGARSLYTGELVEDAVLPFAATLRENMVQAFAERIESAIIDGDADASASTNINDIAGTPAATDYFLNFNGFRKLALITNTANALDVGTLTTAKVLQVMDLMGVGGQYVHSRPQGCAVIMDVNTYSKALQLADVKTRDVNSEMTLESGALTALWNVPVLRSYFMHFMQPSRKANASGLIDLDTAGNNTTGSFIVARFDRWKFYWRRMLTIETTRTPAADATEIVGLARASLKHRDTDASAVGYNVTL